MSLPIVFHLSHRKEYTFSFCALCKTSQVNRVNALTAPRTNQNWQQSSQAHTGTAFTKYKNTLLGLPAVMMIMLLLDLELDALFVMQMVSFVVYNFTNYVDHQTQSGIESGRSVAVEADRK